jgi:hypothetical protein
MSQPNDASGDHGPGWSAWSFLRRIIPKDFPYREEIIGDLLEEWETEILPALGPRGARAWLWGQVLRSIAPMARWRLGQALERLGSDARFVRMVRIGVFVNLIPAVLTILLLLVAGIIVCSILDLGRRAGPPRGMSPLADLWERVRRGIPGVLRVIRRGPNRPRRSLAESAPLVDLAPRQPLATSV